ncbi:uncharacterized protein N7482_006993 [Penicillium canariense]|uniref:tRNA(Ile)-lysidine synthetase n=1 Tax=Penicillium canariense TaxID=189055 RepID=A0A9W9HVW1_9EURO|nr:uncharacterized protein N7482_006993 [Penicillium canariense]KAJ5159989.1 hypothetical protein N7482_006993 [Penicillium canariense]
MAGKKAISVSQFVEHFRRAWLGAQGKLYSGQSLNQNDFNKLPRRLGLAVSGGADSMALAFLCRQLERSALAGPISVTAFVVDHRARAESSQEARTVAGWLTAMGIKTKILELDWASFAKQDRSSQKEGKIPLPSAFETHARHLRFQALGTACRDSGIDALLMGHHQDDTVETTIWRLSSGGRGAGLSGIAEVARIPECHGLFGVSESGSSIKLTPKQGVHPRVQVQIDDRNRGSIVLNPNESEKNTSRKRAANSSVSSSSTENPSTSSDISVATGGIYICRPLLSFPKTSLLETCYQNKIPYVSDPTNFDPTLTPRNAIRSMLASNSLPRALQAPSILSLIRSSQSFLHSSTEFSNQLLSSRLRVLDFNLKAGTMVLQILDLPAFLDPLQSQLPAFRVFQIQSLTLRRITEIISPFHGNRFSVRSYDPFVSHVFPQGSHRGNEDKEKDDPSSPLRQNFTLGGVMFQPLALKSSESQTPGGRNIWRLSRQPFFKNKTPVSRFDIPVQDSKQRNSQPGSKSSTSSTAWTLWDDRYWFRFKLTPSEKNRKSQPGKTRNITLVIRPFQQSDLPKIRADHLMSPEMKWARGKTPAITLNLLRKLLAVEAPGPTRFTIPLLAVERPCETQQPANQEAEQLLALPTLDFRLDALSKKRGPNTIEFSYGEERWKVTWDWMYKMVDIEAIRLMGGPVKAEAESDSVHNDQV